MSKITFKKNLKKKNKIKIKLCGLVFHQSSPVHPFLKSESRGGSTSVTKEGRRTDKQRPEILVSNIGSMRVDEYSKVQRAARAYFKGFGLRQRPLLVIS